MASGDIWIGHAWGSDIYTVQQKKPSVEFYIPEEGSVRGSDAAVILEGAKNPIAANLFINHLLDAKVSADELELHRLHGPERRRPSSTSARTSSTRPGSTPTRRSSTSSRSCSIWASTPTSTRSRWTELKAGI